MQISHHAEQRVNQRGISRRLMNFTLRHGRVEGAKRVLDRKESKRLIESLMEDCGSRDRSWTRAGSRSWRVTTPSSRPTTWEAAMVEALFVLAGAVVGFAIAWFIGGKTREQLAEARVKLSQNEVRLQKTQILLTGTKAELSEAAVALSAQSAMRAAAEALNARMQFGASERLHEGFRVASGPLLQSSIEAVQSLMISTIPFAGYVDARNDRARDWGSPDCS